MKMTVGLTFGLVLTVLLLDGSECAAVTAWSRGTTVLGTTANVISTNCASVPEASTLSLTFTATAGGTPTYAIQTQPTGTTGTYTFAITSAGVLTLSTGVLDYETDKSLVVKIRATDGSDTGDLTCTITLTDVVENAPRFHVASGSIYNVPNQIGIGVDIATILASDADTGTTITYGIVSGNPNNAFAYGTATGLLEVGAAALTTQTYTLVLKATDNGLPVSTGTTTVTVCVGTVCSYSGAAMMAVSALALMASLMATIA